MKVGKGNFRPPPQVESSVVRMSPRDPPPPVRFEEFDGLNRILFSRANKVVRANFQAKGVKEMLERNYRTWCAENGQVSERVEDCPEIICTSLSVLLLHERPYADPPL